MKPQNKPDQAEGWEEELYKVLQSDELIKPLKIEGNKLKVEVNVGVIKDFVRNLLSKKEAEYKKEIKLYEGFLNANSNQINHQPEVRKELEGEINKLKQQHKAELDNLKMDYVDENRITAIGYNDAVTIINKNIDNLLNSQKGK